MNYSKSLLNRKNFGFTLIELIVTIILMSIIAVTLLPRFFKSSGFEEYTYRDELITKLRAIQLRSMQQTNATTCLQIKASVSAIGLLATDASPIICKTSLAGESTTVTIDNNHNVSFTISEGLTSFSFSSLGKPLGCTPVNACEITITVTGEAALTVKINSEGYIYAP